MNCRLSCIWAVVLCLSPFATPTAGSAAGSAGWEQLTAPGTPDSPPARLNNTATWDSRFGRLLVFGGSFSPEGRGLDRHNDLWAYTQQGWQVLTADGADGSPRGRTNHTATWDSQANRLLVFGGYQAGPGPSNDLWAYQPTTATAGRWMQLTDNFAGGSPHPRQAHAAAWDSQAKRLLIFGGTYTPDEQDRHNDLWAYQPVTATSGGGWTELSQDGDLTAPPGRMLPGAAWDGDNNRLLIFGGVLNGGAATNDLWQYTSAGGWKQLTAPGAAGSPPPRTPDGVVWDSASQRLLMFGGSGPNGAYYNDVWQYTDDGGWQQISPQASIQAPAGRQVGGVDWDGQGHLFVFGGMLADGTPTNDLWRFDAVPLRQRRVTAPKSLVIPRFNGRCDDPAYAQAGTLLMSPVDAAGDETPVKILHTGLDFYLCFSAMKRGEVDHIIIRIDGNRDRTGANAPTPIYQLLVNQRGGVTLAQGQADGEMSPITGSGTDVAARVADAGQTGWTAEVRISLEWLGGYARTDGLYLALANIDGAALETWPDTPQIDARGSWGSLILAPLYPPNVSASSVFLDGRGGHLVVPYAPDLNPRELTIEGWVRVVGGSCGTLVGNGHAVSYWLALCRAVQFGYGQGGFISTGSRLLGDGWHHIAVTMDADGVRTSYLDGQVDLLAGSEPQERRNDPEPTTVAQPPHLGVSDRMLRIGSDRDAPNDHNYLHAYVRDLSIWNRPLTAQEIRQTAFHSLQGTEPGLVALWHFTSGLQDSAGSHDVGLIGDASLAREAPNVQSFPRPPPTGPPFHFQPTGPQPPWNARIPYSDAPVEIDGMCRPSEYEGGTTLRPEPDRSFAIDLMLRRDGLYACANVLFGSLQAGDSLTLWLDGTGMGGTRPGRGQLRLQLRPDGKVVAGVGNGQGYTTAVLQDVVSQTVGGPELTPQEDLPTYHAPWWSTELRIPMRLLAPFSPGRRLRLALLYHGTVPAGTLPEISSTQNVRESWPASFDANRPGTWGAVATGSPTSIQLSAQEPATIDTVTSMVGKLHTALSPLGHTLPSRGHSVARAIRDSIHMSIPDYTGFGVTTQDFHKICDWNSKPWGLPLITNPDVKWAKLGTVEAEGTLDNIELSNEDFPAIHDSHDLDMSLQIDHSRFGKLVIDGKDDNLILETESGQFPHTFRPSTGDHVTVKGRWIFDCGHDEPGNPAHTEIHPTPYFESDHLEARRLGPGPDLRTVRVAQVWMNANPGAFKYDLKTYGPFDFDLQLPWKSLHDWMPFAEVVRPEKPSPIYTDGDPAKVKFMVEGGKIHVRIDPPEINWLTGPGVPFPLKVQWAHYEIVVGYLKKDPDSIASAARSYTVHLDKIDVVHDLRGLRGYGWGGWFLDADVNHHWVAIFRDAKVSSSEKGYDLNIPINTTDSRLTIRMTGYMNDDPLAGPVLARHEWDLGPLSEQKGTEWHLCQRTLDYPENLKDPGCADWNHSAWVLYYHVTDGPALSPILKSSGFWSPRLASKAKLPAPTDLGEVPVDQPPRISTTYPEREVDHNGYITEQRLPYGKSYQPLDSSGVDGLTRLGSDLDRYSFSLADFANVTIPNPAPGVMASPQPSDPWFKADPSDPWKDDLPKVQKALGYRHATVTVQSVDGHVGDTPYTLRVRTTWRDLPPDWGVANDKPGSGRLVDLLTPDSHAALAPGDEAEPDNRTLLMRWAWQHVPGEIHYYDVLVPPAATRPNGQKPCVGGDIPTDKLTISAYGMRLHIPGGQLAGTIKGKPVVRDLDATNEATISDLKTLFPDGHVHVQVRSIGAERSAYRLKAKWTDARFLSPEDCARLGSFKKTVEEPIVQIFPPKLSDLLRWWGPDPRSLPAGGWTDVIPVYSLGGGVPVVLKQGQSVDTVISSEAGRPVLARLYDASGVLLGESQDQGLGVQAAPVGLEPSGRLTVHGLDAGSPYYLQLVPDFTAGPEGLETRIGLSLPSP